MAAERGNFFVNKIKESIEKGAEFAKKWDFILIGSGLVVFAFAPGLGAAMIIGSAITIIPEEKLRRWARKR